LRAEHPLSASADLTALQDTAGELTAAGERREAVIQANALGTLLWEWEPLGSMMCLFAAHQTLTGEIHAEY